MRDMLLPAVNHIEGGCRRKYSNPRKTIKLTSTLKRCRNPPRSLPKRRKYSARDKAARGLFIRCCGKLPRSTAEYLMARLRKSWKSGHVVFDNRDSTSTISEGPRPDRSPSRASRLLGSTTPTIETKFVFCCGARFPSATAICT